MYPFKLPVAIGPSSSCQVKKCRFPQTHITSCHKCGKCDEFGHGKLECGNEDLIKNILRPIFFSPMVFDPEVKLVVECIHPKCQDRNTHSIEAHQVEFEKSAFGAYLKSLDLSTRKLLKNHVGYYTMAGIGHGYQYVWRNNIKNGVEMVQLGYDEDKEFQEFTKGYHRYLTK